MKFKTVREGSQALVLNHLGEGRILVGPQRVFLFRQSLQVLQNYTATPDQYLKIKWQDGRTEHRSGPVSMFLNPLEHERIEMLSGIKLNANQALIVYKTTAEKTGSIVERRIVYGPIVFIPTADEWLHEFKWHGADMKTNKTVMIPEFAKFTKLSIIPQHFYYNVREVRTCDDTQIVVKLMIFYELTDIEKMLELTHDPIADFINAVCADVVSFATKLSYEEFQQQASKLNSQNTYPQLMQRAKRIGYNISKVVYRATMQGITCSLCKMMPSRVELS
ncbi:uncharacterized protein [Ptychodera flava]|uniref:uncharacterized protein n=1 Tax=Ptychodera flava TaxID=63121 RepID=UPI00396A1E0A